MLVRLKPCPFCGRNPKVISGHVHPSMEIHYSLYCCCCHYHQYRRLEDIAAKWNKRAEIKEEKISQHITHNSAMDAIAKLRNFFSNTNNYAPDSIVWSNLRELSEILQQHQ